MFYEITGIKEQNDGAINIHVLIDHDSPKQLRDSLQAMDIIILGIKESFSSPEERGKTRAMATYPDGMEHEIVQQEADPFEAAIFLFMLGFEVTSVNTIDNKLDPDKISKIVSDAKDEVTEELSEQKAEIVQAQTKSRKVYEDKELLKLQNILDEIFDYLQKLYPKIEGVIIPERISRLHKLEEQLRKLKMGRNPTKIKELLTIFFKLLDKIAENYLKHMKENNISAKKILPESEIVERELIEEYHKLKRSETVKTLNIKKNKSDSYYIFTEKHWIFIKFLKKDILHKLGDTTLLWYKTFDLLQFMLIVVCVELGFLLWGQKILGNGQESQHIFIVLIHLGILAILLFVLSFFRKKNMWRLLLLLILWIGLYFLVSQIVMMNFAL